MSDAGASGAASESRGLDQGYVPGAPTPGPLDPIALDRFAIKALACDTRVDLLRALLSRRKTATELARECGLDKSSAHRHLRVLESAALVTRADGDRKWVYYALTRKSELLLLPAAATSWFFVDEAGAAACGDEVVSG